MGTENVDQDHLIKALPNGKPRIFFHRYSIQCIQRRVFLFRAAQYVQHVDNPRAPMRSLCGLKNHSIHPMWVVAHPSNHKSYICVCRVESQICIL